MSENYLERLKRVSAEATTEVEAYPKWCKALLNQTEQQSGEAVQEYAVTLPASIFAVLRVNPHPEEMVCLRWKKEDAEEQAKAQQLLYPSAIYEVIQWFVN